MRARTIVILAVLGCAGASIHCESGGGKEEGVCLLNSGLACNDNVGREQCEWGTGDWVDTDQSCRDLGYG